MNTLEQQDTVRDPTSTCCVDIDTLIDARVGAHHRIVDHLASGGMGHVFLARHTHLRRRAALKLLAGTTPALATCFAREAELLMRQHHPHIVRGLERGVLDDGSPYLLMEYLPGMDLQRWLKRNPQRSHAVVLSILDQVAGAVDHLHAQGILHRDLKPANVMFDPRRGHATLIDLGVAIPENSDARTHSMLVGTPSYIAPEHAAGEPCTRASDIYSVAALAMELLTGAPPYPFTSLSQTMTALLFERAPLPSERGVSVAGLDTCMERALARDPERRFATAGEFVQALRTILDEHARGSSSSACSHKLRPIARRAQLAPLPLTAATRDDSFAVAS